MRRHSFVVTLAVGALALGACKKTEPIHGNPPMPEPIGNPPTPEPEPEMTHNPPMPTTTDPVIISANPPPQTGPSSLPTWDQVPSGHPEGATNPPIPHLVVKPDGSCFKLWRSPMMRTEPAHMGDYVDPDCAGTDCGVAIQCPEQAATVLDEWKKAGGADPGEL